MAPTIAALEITVRDERNDPPEFKRVYAAALINGFRVKVTMCTRVYGGRTAYLSEVTQPNGRWILFDVHRVADKIIDRELLPAVEAASRQILAMDAAFMATDPRQFTDLKGRTWQRLN